MAEPNYPTFEVAKDDDGIRPNGEPDSCFYCQQKVGKLHTKNCVITWRDKKVKLIALVEFEEEVPEHWDEEDIRFRYNDSTWCASNLFDRFDNEDDETNSCGCRETTVFQPYQVQTIEVRK